MDIHHVDRRVVRVVLDEDRFNVKQPAVNIEAEVVMEAMFAPLRPRLPNLVDFASRCKETEHFFCDKAGCQPLDIPFKPLAGNRLSSDVTGEPPLAQSKLKLRQDPRVSQPSHCGFFAAGNRPALHGSL
jgi:hypothetical protein